MSILFRSSSPSDSIYATDSLQEDPIKEESEDSSGLLSDSVGSCSSASETSLSSSTTPSTAKEKYAILPDIDSPTILFGNPGVINLIEKDDDSSKIRNSSQGSNDIRGLSEVKSSTPDPFTTLDPIRNQSYVDIGFLEGEKNIPKQSLKDIVGSSNAYCAVNAVSNSLECLITELANSNCDSLSKDKGFSHPSTLTRSPSKKTVTKSEFSKDQFPQNDFVGKTIWESKNPFNPFLADNPPGIPLLNHFQNLPFPRPASKISECLPQMPLTPQVPNHGLPPPLPERKKLPQVSARSTFDLDTIPLPPPLQLQKDPNLPPSSRKLPPINELVESRKVSSHGMIGQEKRPDLAAVFRHHQGQMGEFSKEPESCEMPPPLPPKPDFLSRERQSPIKSKPSPTASCDSGSSMSSSAEFSKGSQSSSSSELHSSDNSAFGSSAEALFSNSISNQSDVFPDISQTLNSPSMISKSNEDPDSIFRRRSDPFADEFFLNLRKPLQELEK